MVLKDRPNLPNDSVVVVDTVIESKTAPQLRCWWFSPIAVGPAPPLAVVLRFYPVMEGSIEISRSKNIVVPTLFSSLWMCVVNSDR
jgi:hypothetical protein